MSIDTSEVAEWRTAHNNVWDRANAMVSNTWEPRVWCIWYHSTDSAPGITTSPSSPTKVPPTSCDRYTMKSRPISTVFFGFVDKWQNQGLTVEFKQENRKPSTLIMNLLPHTLREIYDPRPPFKCHSSLMSEWSKFLRYLQHSLVGYALPFKTTDYAPCTNSTVVNIQLKIFGTLEGPVHADHYFKTQLLVARS